jgi:hypothetical protein
MHRDFHDLPLVSVQECFSAIVDTITVDSGRLASACPCSTWGAFGACSTLRTRPGWVCTPVLAMSDTQVSVLWLILDSINSLDGVRDIGEVDECTVPSKTINKTLNRKRDKK